MYDSVYGYVCRCVEIVRMGQVLTIQSVVQGLAASASFRSLSKMQNLGGHGGSQLSSQHFGRLRKEDCLNPGGLRPFWATQ